MVCNSRKRSCHRFNIYVSVIKIDADGLCASEAQYIWRHRLKMQINKNTTTSYALQCKIDGEYLNPFCGKAGVKGRTHKTGNYPFCLFVPNHLEIG